MTRAGDDAERSDGEERRIVSAGDDAERSDGEERRIVPAKSPLLSIGGLEVRFGDDPPAVRRVDLTVRSGQTVAVVGESGSGKSTTAAAILGLLPPGGRVTAGRIVFDGVDITSAGRRRLRSIRGVGIGYVPQDPMTNLNPVWKVGFQVREALRANNISDVRRQSVRLLAEAGMPDPVTRARQYPHQLSGGMCQRALIAIGLAGRPRLLIADEPTSALDVTVQRQVLDHLQRLTGQLGTAVLLITHDLALAAERAEHLIVMHGGVVVEAGAARSILQEPKHPYTQRLVAVAPSLRGTGAAVTRQRVADEAAEHAGRLGGAQDVVVASELTKVYRTSHGAPWRKVELRAVDEVSFRLRRATTLAIAGESGSGKSTLARMVLGLLQPTSGTVVFDGLSVSDIAALRRAEMFAFRRRMQPVFQNPYSSLDPMYSVFHTIEEPLRIHRIGDRQQRRQAVRELVEQVALSSSVLSRRPRELSGGQRQRVAIARALALRPQVLVCDEAVSALDVVVQAQILDLLAELQAALGLTYLFISHDLAVIRQIADEVMVMRAGRVVEHGPTEAVFTQPRHDYTRELLEAIPSGRWV
jgi:peptide/nickel transport system ATP-binding protein